MPHAIIEFDQSLTTKITPETLMANVFDGAVHSALFDKADINTKGIKLVISFK